MSPIERLVLILVILLLVAFVYAYFYRTDLLRKNIFLDKLLLERGTNQTPIWLFYPSSEVNSRYWSDFGARSTRALNIPFLNLCYQSIVENNKDYYVRVISGVSGLSELLGEDALPSGFRRDGDIASINEAEMNWIRTAILAKYGGLWLNPATICLKSFGELPKDKIVFFGTNLEETYAGKNGGTSTPGTNALYVPYPNHPMMKEWERVCFERIDHKRGGEQIRGDFNWDFVRFTTEYVHTGIVVDPAAEGMRKKDGKRIQLEDLLATGTDGNLPFDTCSYTVYIPFPWTELRDREMFGWFLRMSEKQIMESDIAVKYLLQKSLSY